MRRTGSARVEGHALLAAAGLIGALVLRRPELALAVTPFALALAVGTRSRPDPEVRVDLALAADRTLEGLEVEATLSARAQRNVDHVEVGLSTPPGVAVEEGTAFAFRLRAGEEHTLPLTFSCTSWGVYDVGELEVRACDRLRMIVWEDSVREPRRLKAYPTEETLKRIVTPLETQAFTGSEVARVKGDGIEYADIREYVPGDRLRSINWRASARSARLVVNERHPERNTDVVVFVDSFADIREGDRSTLDEAVRAAATLTTRYLARRDRVGLVSFGGILRWIQPGMGVGQRYRLIETLLETGVQPTYTWRHVDLIPPRILPPKALVIALTPLVDPRFVTALEDLRARGFDLAVVEIDPVGLVRAGRSEVDRLAYRLWRLEREVLRGRLERLGIGVARWGDDLALETALEEVRTYRRYARLARV